LSVTSVITPSAPSEPISSWRKSGPAAVAGRSRATISPAGVTQRSPVTSSAIAP